MTFYGGDLPGIVQHLDHLERLGVNVIYLNPVFTAYSSHRYDPIDYTHVDPTWARLNTRRAQLYGRK
jgi:glycosidase